MKKNQAYTVNKSGSSTSQHTPQVIQFIMLKELSDTLNRMMTSKNIYGSMKNALASIQNENYMEAIAHLKRCEHYDDHAHMERLLESSREIITYAIAECEFKLCNIIEAYETLIEIKGTVNTIHGLASTIQKYTDALKENARNIIASIDFNEDCDNVYLMLAKDKIQEAEKIYKILKVEPPRQIATIKQNIEWLEIRARTHSNFSELYSKRGTIKEYTGYYAELKICSDQYKKHQIFFDTQDKEDYSALQPLIEQVYTKMLAQVLREIRDKHHAFISELGFYMRAGDLTSAEKKLKSIMRITQDIRGLIEELSERNENDILEAIQPNEHAEYYTESMRILTYALNDFQARANDKSNSMANYIINTGIKLKNQPSTPVALSTADKLNLHKFISNQLISSWYKFDNLDEIHLIGFLTDLSKKLTQHLCCYSGPKVTLSFRGYNLYILDLPELEKKFERSIQAYTPEISRAYISLPIFTYTPPTPPIGDLLDLNPVPLALVANERMDGNLRQERPCNNK